MTEDTTALTTTQQEADRLRKQAILRAVGLDVVPPEQRELALAIANRYDLDLMLKHLVLIDGRPYITRDALLWVAHRSGHFDGIHSTEPSIKEFPGLGQCWYSEVTVWRDDMTHPFTYGGRYPTGGQNRKYGPEMAIKVAECMALRRAFNVSAATVEERQWEQDENAVMAEQPQPQTLAEVVQQRVQAVAAPTDVAPEAPQRPTTPVKAPDPVATPPKPAQPVVAPHSPAKDFVSDMNALAGAEPTTPPEATPEPLFPDLPAVEGEFTEEAPPPEPSFTQKMEAAGAPAKPPRTRATKAPAEVTPAEHKPPVIPPQQILPAMPAPATEPEEAPITQCPAMSPFTENARCRLHAGHKGAHRSSPNESWAPSGPAIVD